MPTLSAWGHSCVLLERDGRHLVVDPGGWSDLTVLGVADAVLVTHEHRDHLDVAAVLAALVDRPGLDVWGPASALDLLAAGGASSERLHRVVDGDHLAVVGFDVLVLGEYHATVHPDLPVPRNAAYLLDGKVLHPGDSFTVPRPGTTVDVLLTPVTAPWLTIAESIDYVRACAPRVVVPIHDAIASDVGRALADRLVTMLGGDVEYLRLDPGQTLTVP